MNVVGAAGLLAVCAALSPAQSPAGRTAVPAEPAAQAQRNPVLLAQRRPSARRQPGNWRTRQQVIDRQRARQIQEALIREGYLKEGEADGVWGERSKAAMEKYQGDNGWQTKIVPDSRALIKLGLGPEYAGVLNPESVARAETTPGGGVATADGGRSAGDSGAGSAP